MRTVKSVLSTTGIAAVLGLAPMSATAFEFNTDALDRKVKVSFGGYAKLSALFTDTSDGQIAGNNAGRTFYVPSTTPIGGESGDAVLDMTARESRFNFKAKTQGGGHAVGVVLEMDFLTTTGGNEAVSNSYVPRMRHYFFTYDNWLFGQTWFTFMDTGALPDAVDFLGAPEGTVFGRQPMIRYSSGPFQIALENPETSTSGGADALSDDNILPDLAGNYSIKGDWGHARLNGLLRQLKVDTAADATAGIPKADDDAVGWGIGASGKVKVFGADDIRFAVNYGDGMGRYTSVGAVKDAVVDGSGKLDTVKSLAGFIAYRHFWTGKLRSSLIGSLLDVDNPDSGAATLNDKIYSVQVNLIYSPVKKVDFGIMYLHANRKEDSGADGDLDRVQVMAKYAF